MKTIGLENAVESFELHDSHGNTCAAALFNRGSDFELYLWDFNSSVPRRITGDIGIVKHQMDVFFFAKLKAGFIQPLADENGKAVRFS